MGSDARKNGDIEALADARRALKNNTSVSFGKKDQIVKGYCILVEIRDSAKQLLLLVFSTYIMLRFLRNFFFLIFLFGPGFGASNKKEIKKLKKKVQLMEHIIGNIHDCIAYLYA